MLAIVGRRNSEGLSAYPQAGHEGQIDPTCDNLGESPTYRTQTGIRVGGILSVIAMYANDPSKT